MQNEIENARLDSAFEGYGLRSTTNLDRCLRPAGTAQLAPLRVYLRDIPSDYFLAFRSDISTRASSRSAWAKNTASARSSAATALSSRRS